MSHIIPTLMIDIAAGALDDKDRAILQNPHVAGVILFARNIETPTQVRALTDSIRTLNPNCIIATDQEGGRVARLKEGFTRLPAMGALGQQYTQNPQSALTLAYQTGYVMACEVLAVGIDISFAPVLDIDNGSLVIGDRAFAQDPKTASLLASRFIDGMNAAGMQATGKHFPGHGSVIPDSHTHDAIDDRPLSQIWQHDTQVFIQNLARLGALMPAHVVFSQIDNKPAGFSAVWLQDIIRKQLGFDGVLFSDDLSMKAACVAGDADARVAAALAAGCDVALICNDRQGTQTALQAMDSLTHLLPTTARFGRMKSTIPPWQGDLQKTASVAFAQYTEAKEAVRQFCAHE